MISFGTPFYTIGRSSSFEFTGISVGHLKLMHTYKYDSNNILNLLHYLHHETPKQYIHHLSYVYMCYFMTLHISKGNVWTVCISDAFLFIDSRDEYLFSINFPMSICAYSNSKKPNTRKLNTHEPDLIFSMGMGDYYTKVIADNRVSISTLCKHDIQQMKMSNYHYHIVDVAKTDATSLQDILTTNHSSMVFSTSHSHSLAT